MVIDQVLSVMNYSQTFQLEEKVPFIGTETSDITCNIDYCAFIWIAKMCTFCHLIRITKLFSEAKTSSCSSRRIGGEPSTAKTSTSCVDYLDDATLPTATRKDSRFLAMTADK